MKGVKTITGKIYPKVGETNFYEVTEFHKGTVVIHPENIKWKLYHKKEGKWVELEIPVKTGKKVTFNFPQKWYTKELLIEAYIFEAEGKAPPGIIVKPCMGDRKINNTEILNAEGGKITQMPKYGQSITLRATTENMLGEVLKLSLWERDTYSDKGHDPKGNQLLWSGNSKRVNNKGFGEQKIMLSPAMMQLANKSMFEGKTHEYYLLVEADKRQAISQTTFVSSEIVLSKNAPKPKPDTKAQPTPKPIQEQVVVKVKDSLGHDTIKVEGISKVVVEIPDEKDIIKKKGKCFCNRDIKYDELIALGIGKKNSDKFLDSINSTMKNYNINTCKRKLHFLAQVRHESGEFAFQKEIWGPTKAQLGYEGRKDIGNVNTGDGKRFMGRGLIQMTGRTNYENYGTYKKEDFLTEPNNKKMSELPHCVDSAGWYWSKNLSVDLNDYADKDDVIYITYRINGGFNGYTEDRKPKLIQMIKSIKCENTKFENNDAYSIKKSKLWDNYDAVYTYAKLNTSESKDCYKRFLELTDSYLTWDSIKKSPKKKLKMETKRKTANEKN